MEQKSFWRWYTENVKTAGPLISAAVAAKLLGTRRQYIQNLIYRKKLTKYTFDNLTFVGLNEINELYIKKQEATHMLRAVALDIINTIEEVKKELTPEQLKKLEKHEISLQQAKDFEESQ